MRVKKITKKSARTRSLTHHITAVMLGLAALTAQATEVEADPAVPINVEAAGLSTYARSARDWVSHTTDAASGLIDKGLSFIGIRYRFGGDGPESGGFDCSGLVRKVFSEALGLELPRTAAQMAQLGEKINKDDLKPGDLVFFNTMRRSFSHVGIYLGGNQFLHAPSRGGKVRVDDMGERYWVQRFTGARRIAAASDEAIAAAPDQAPSGSNFFDFSRSR